MSTGGADDSARPGDGGHPPENRQDPRDGAGEASAPWERPRRWSRERTDVTRVEDLRARLSSSDSSGESRRQRRAGTESADAVPASELIAALGAARSNPQSADQRDVEPAEPDTDSAEPDTDRPAADPPQPTDSAQQTDPAQPSDSAQPSDDSTDAADHPPSAPDEPGDESGSASDEAGSESAYDDTVVIRAAVQDGDDEGNGPAGDLDPDAQSGADVSWESVLASLRRQVGSPAGAKGSTGGGGNPPPTDPSMGGSLAHADHPHRGWLTAGRSVMVLIAVLTLLATGTEWVIKHRADEVLATRQVQAIVPNDTNVSTPTDGSSPAGPTVPAGPVGIGDHEQATVAPKEYQAENILLMGSDTRAGKENTHLGGAGIQTMQSDVLMIAHLSADRSHITVVSIPRDTYVHAIACEAWDYQANALSDKDYTSPYTEWKITNAYSIGGPQCTVRAVQQLTGLQIDRVIIIDFAGFKSMVDALDGITVDACRPIIDGNLGAVLASGGKQHINGTQALGLVRAREVRGDSASDLSRIHRQQVVLSTILREVTSAGVLLNPGKLDSLLQAFVHNVSTDNVTLDDLIELAHSLGDLSPSHVTFYTLPTVADGQGLRMAPAGRTIWNALVNDQPLPGEVTGTPNTGATPTRAPAGVSGHGQAAPTATTGPVTRVLTSVVTSTPDVPQQVSVTPRDIDLQVVNVAGRGGVATQAMNALEPLGFDIPDSDLLLIPGDVRDGSTVEYSAGNRNAAVTVAAAVPGATLVQTDGLGSRVRLMLGSSFDGAVRAVTVGAPVPAALSTTPSPVVSTVVTTTVEPDAGGAVTTTTPVSTSGESTTGPTISSGEVATVNAGDAGCI